MGIKKEDYLAKKKMYKKKINVWKENPWVWIILTVWSGLLFIYYFWINDIERGILFAGFMCFSFLNAINFSNMLEIKEMIQCQKYQSNKR